MWLGDLRKAEELKEDTGCYFQVNSASVLGAAWNGRKNCYQKVIETGAH